MRTLGTTLGVFFLSGTFLLGPASALAQRSEPASIQSLASEYQRLRADLDRLNADVAALKNRGRSVRTDYLLRDKMAEAEALARRVTAAEVRLRAVRGPLPPETPAGAVQTPSATSQDGAVELEAKADLLSDQARRFRAEAETLARTAEQIRARQALRRRAGAWDRDPLAGFEASKRVAVLPAQSSHVVASSDTSGASAATRGPVPATTDGSKAGGSATGALTPAVPADSAGSSAAPPTFAIVAGASTPGPGSATAVATPSASHPLTASGPLSTDSATKSALQQRTLLDPATLAGLRNTLSQAGSLSDPDAVDAAATALRNHAQALDEQARRLRARASQ